jgi:hypothetical protein
MHARSCSGDQLGGPDRNAAAHGEHPFLRRVQAGARPVGA